MVFSSLFFLYFFFPLCIILYAANKNVRNKNIILVIFSLVFYAWGEPVYVLLLIASATLNFFFGKITAKSEKPKLSKAILILSIILNISILAVFKYSGFLVENINLITKANIPVPDIRLPIGISFYTFQTMSYVIDCYWQTVKPQKNYLNFLMYVSLFPQLVAGPIVRYSTIESEITNRKTTSTDLSEGFTRIAMGLGKKVILADNLSTIADTFLTDSLSNISVLGAWYGVIIYSMQIYFDFSGYSDMAIGMGRILGFHFDENFKHPFICKDITEFWQRWHISLGTFFRDYLLYVPIFGKRRKYGGLFLVWMCTGLWHGASWNYVIWGLYYGVFILLESLIGKKKMNKIPVVVRHIYNKLVIIIGFGIFYFESLGNLGTFLKSLIGLNNNSFTDIQLEISVVNNIFILIIALICCFPVVDFIKKKFVRNGATQLVYSLGGTVLCAGIIIVSSILLVNSTNHPFLYFRF
jgi:alginate O-acetyltransferase complex protein AlgI